MDASADLLRQGMAALRAGDRATAETLLARATQMDPNNEQAWLWLSGAASTPAEQRRCLEQVLRINPQNDAAKRGLEKLGLAPVIVTPAPPPTPALVPAETVAAPTAVPLPDPSKAQGHWAKPIGVIALILVLCVSLPFLGRLMGRAPSASYTPDRIGAYVMCKDFVAKRLKAPGTAEFGSSLDAEIRDLGSNRWSVISYVDAENSFGAQLRMNFDCTVRYTGNEMWQLEELVTDP